MRGRLFTISLVTIGVAIATTPAQPVFAYEIDTHAYLTHVVFDFYNRRTPDRKIPAELEPYLLDGSRREDDNERSLNHFYDPIHDVGLHTPALGTWQASKDWANDVVNQTKLKYRVPATIASVLSAVQERKLSLVSDDTDFTWREAVRAWVNGEREKAMYTLGHVLHLIEDASVPEHTRNDPHPQMSPYEDWTKQFTVFDQDAGLETRLLNKRLLTLPTLGEYFNSLAKYSNENFFSGDTLNSGIFEKPTARLIPKQIGNGYFGISNTSDGGENVLVYYKDFKGGMVFISEWQPSLEDPNDVVISDYWSRLSVKAVQHGAGIVKLFFDEVDRAAKDSTFIREKNPSVLVRLVDHMGKLVGAIVANVADVGRAMRDNAAAMGDLFTRLAAGENIVTIANENGSAAIPIRPDIGFSLTNEGFAGSFPILPLVSAELTITPPKSAEILGTSTSPASGLPAVTIALTTDPPPDVVGSFEALFANPSGIPSSDPFAGLFLDTGGSAMPGSFSQTAGTDGSETGSLPSPVESTTTEPVSEVTSTTHLPPGSPRNLALAWEATTTELTVTWDDAEDPDTPTSSLAYRMSVNDASSTIATSGVRITAAYATEYAVSVTAEDPEGNVSDRAIATTTTPVAPEPEPPAETTLLEVTDAITDSGFWGRGTDTGINEIAERYVPVADQHACAVRHQIVGFSGSVDAVTLTVWTDGVGGTVVATSSVPASALPGSAETPTEFRFSSCTPLTAGTAYWFHFSRTAPTAMNGYISRFRPADQFSNTSYWQLQPWTMSPMGWVEYPAREWSFTVIGY